MAMHYLIDEDAADETILPSVEVFFRTEWAMLADGWVDEDGEPMAEGWYWWTCLPGCLPDSDPCGPFESEAAALADARYEYDKAN